MIPHAHKHLSINLCYTLIMLQAHHINDKEYELKLLKVLGKGQTITKDMIEDDIKWFYKQAHLDFKDIIIFEGYKEFKNYIRSHHGGYYHSYRYIEQEQYDNVNFGLKYEISKMLEYNYYWAELNEDQKRYANLLLKGIFIFSPYNNEALILPCPRMKMNDLNRPHSLNDKAIKWKSGKGRHFINGVFFDKATWIKVTKRKYTPTQILKLSNIERRYTAIQLFNVEDILNDLDSKVINKSQNRDNILYEIDLKETVNEWNTESNKTISHELIAKCIKYKCPSTNRVYLSFVPDKIATADQGMAWKFHITTKQYKGLKVEA